mmetsp:Transcript_46475/g.100970  ORF Transcript_46475/g.100970 Transcript_46475/m.100970 type:complete len:217 (-) Transcript_46475:164-814(-)
MVVLCSVFAILHSNVEEPEAGVGMVGQDVAYHIIFQQQSSRNDELRRHLLGSAHNIYAGRAFMEQRQRPLDHGLLAVSALQIHSDLIDYQPQNGILVLQAENRCQPLRNLLLTDLALGLLGMLADVHLPELFQEIQVRQLQRLWYDVLLLDVRISNPHELKDTLGQLPVDHVRRRGVRISSDGFGASAVSTNQRPDHVDHPHSLRCHCRLGHHGSE